MLSGFTNSENSVTSMKRNASIAALAALSGKICMLEMGHRWLTAYIWGKLNKLPEARNSKFESEAITIGAKCGATVLAIHNLCELLNDNPMIDTFEKFESAFDFGYTAIKDDIQNEIDDLRSFFANNAVDVQMIIDGSSCIDDPDPDDGMTLREIPSHIVTGIVPFDDDTAVGKCIRSLKCVRRIINHRLNDYSN